MKFFENIETLFEEIEKDKILKSGYTGRYLTRVIFLDDFNQFNEIINRLGVVKIDLANLLPSEKKWFTADSLVKLIRDQNNSAVIFPLSEVLRFFTNEKMQSTLITIFESQNNSENLTKRIYLPLVGLYEKFTNQFWNKFHRKTEGPPIWKLKSSEGINRIKIYKLNTEIKTNLTLISNNQQWLSYWKSERLSPVISVSSTLNRRWKYFLTDDCFENKLLKNIADFLNEIYSFYIDYEYQEYEKHFWKKLLDIYENEYIDKAKDFKHFLSLHFNISNLNSVEDKDLMHIYLKSEKFEKWLLKCFILSFRNDINYLFLILNDCSEYSNYEILSLLYYKILEIENPHNDMIEQRFEVIKEIFSDYEKDISQFINKFLNKLSSISIEAGFKFITGHTFEEKKYLLNYLSELETEKLTNLLKSKIPDLYHYLDWERVSSVYKISAKDWVFNYFQLYNKSKLINRSLQTFENMFNQINSNTNSFFSWYFEFDEIPEITDGTVVQIDALGMEWLPYILHLIEEYSKKSDIKLSDISIRRAKLPTITKINKINNSKYIQSLDLLLHDHKGYKYPETLLLQLDLIKNIIINDILKMQDEKIYITADHGSTCQCLKRFGRIKKYDFADVEHEGRCLEKSNNLPDNESFFNHNKYYIALRYDSLSSLPKREVHGGATPEEVLIPLIVLEKESERIEYAIIIKNKIISYNNRVIEIKVKPKPKLQPTLNINEMVIYSKTIEGGFIFDLSNLNSGSYSAEINVENQKDTIEFKISGGLQEEDLF